jgi:hypothetical protein
MFFDLEYQDGLYYCSTDVFAVDQDNPVQVNCQRTNATAPPGIHRVPSKFVPTSKA